MAFTRITAPTNNIASLDNKPTIPANTLKQKFDQIGEDLKTYVDDTLLVELEATTASDSLGHDSASITSDTVGGALEENRLQVDNKANTADVYTKTETYSKSIEK